MTKALAVLFIISIVIDVAFGVKDGKRTPSDKILDMIKEKLRNSLNKESEKTRQLRDDINRIVYDIVLVRNIVRLDDVCTIIAHTIVWELQKPILGRRIKTVESKEAEEHNGGYYDKKDDKVFVNKYLIMKAVEEEDTTIYWNKLLKTCCHEMRHAWQFDKGWDFSKYIQPEVNFFKYKWQRCEADARLFAFLVVHCLMTNKKKERLLRIILKNISKLY